MMDEGTSESGSSSLHIVDGGSGAGAGSVRAVHSPNLPSLPSMAMAGEDEHGGGGTGSYTGDSIGSSHEQHQHEDGTPNGESGPIAAEDDQQYDESVLRALCDSDCAMPLVLERLKQSAASARETSAFLKRRAMVEDDYAKAMVKLTRSTVESYAMSEAKAGSFNSSFQAMLRIHDVLADNHARLSAQLNEMADELAASAKEADRQRKMHRDTSARYEKTLQEQDSLVDKARGRFDTTAEELERVLLLKNGEAGLTSSQLSPGNGASGANSKRSFGKAMSKLKGPKTSAQVAKQEEDVRSRMGQSSDSLRAVMEGADRTRRDFFTVQLPKMVRATKDQIDDVDLGTTYHLARYAYLYETALVADGLAICPLNIEDGPGLKGVVDSIDLRDDFKTFMSQYNANWQMSGQRGPRRDGLLEDSYHAKQFSPAVNSMATASSSNQQPIQPTFGVDLGEQMDRDNVDVPRVLEKCCEAIEMHGLESVGIYRLSGTTSRVQKLKAALDYDVEGVDLLSEENLADINDIAGVLKLWFRELPEPLLTYDLYYGFVEAAKIENERLRHIRLHERVNELPDPNYATLKYLMGHLDRVRQHESVNQMTSSNLAIVFGPNLLNAPPGAGGSALADMSWQCKCVETILDHYAAIFVETE